MRDTLARGLVVIACGLIAYGISGLVNEFRRGPRMKKRPAVEWLKNALLTQALVSVRTSDFSDDRDYASYDGTKLPPVSVQEDWTTYIVDLDGLRKGEAPLMEQKLFAIDRYLDQNLDTYDQAEKLLDDFHDWCYHNNKM